MTKMMLQQYHDDLLQKIIMLERTMYDLIDDINRKIDDTNEQIDDKFDILHNEINPN